MNVFYSPSLNGFLLKETADEYEGKDLVEVSQDIYDQFLSGSETQIMVPGDNGPVWKDAPTPTKEELIAAAEQMRQQLFAYADATVLDWRTELMLGEISDANKIKLSAWMVYKNEVKSVDVTADPKHVNWPNLPKV
uniref:tail fiber assembly protein n=1 Tax=Hafnia alvei TaxID=569 RepID=UPI0026EDD54E|nr:tail fiber assembly protein [Hafnia alvei]